MNPFGHRIGGKPFTMNLRGVLVTLTRLPPPPKSDPARFDRFITEEIVQQIAPPPAFLSLLLSRCGSAKSKWSLKVLFVFLNDLDDDWTKRPRGWTPPTGAGRPNVIALSASTSARDEQLKVILDEEMDIRVEISTRTVQVPLGSNALHIHRREREVNAGASKERKCASICDGTVRFRIVAPGKHGFVIIPGLCDSQRPTFTQSWDI